MVGHEAIDAEVEEAFSVLVGVDSPDDEAEVEGAGEVAESFIEDAEAMTVFRDMNGATGAGPEEAVEPEEGSGEEEGDLPGVGGGGKLGLEAANLANGVGEERTEDDVILALEAGDSIENGVDEAGGIAFEVEVETSAGECGEGLLEGEQAQAGTAEREVDAVGGEAIAGVEMLELGESEMRNGALAIGLVVEKGFVTENDVAVAGGHEVDLDGIDAEVTGGEQGGEGVFGIAAGPAAVADEKRAGGEAEAARVMGPTHGVIQ